MWGNGDAPCRTGVWPIIFRLGHRWTVASLSAEYCRACDVGDVVRAQRLEMSLREVRQAHDMAAHLLLHE
jgi:hypothetical protein